MLFLFSVYFLFEDAVTLCVLGAGTSFGESILTNKPRHATVVTQDFTELIRVEQKDFKILWEVQQFYIINGGKHSCCELQLLLQNYFTAVVVVVLVTAVVAVVLVTAVVAVVLVTAVVVPLNFATCRL